MSARVIFELNTWQWLTRLSRQQGRPVTLGTVPAAEWDRLALPGINTVWLMGVWQRSPAARRISASDPAFTKDHTCSLPDLTPEDLIGSPYAIHDYSVDLHLGGTAELAQARTELARRGLKLILDFVPNHVAPDHPWLTANPEYLIQGTREDLASDSALFFAASSGGVFAHGRDPYFAPWYDTTQVNGFHSGLRSAAAATLSRVADQCDGVRCDMAMLLLNDVFAKTWAGRAGTTPKTEYWLEVIPAVRARHPDFLFFAEVYWGMEARLLEIGFSACYDKRLYDRLCAGDAEGIRAHLTAPPEYQRRMIRFLENHDESRAAAIFGNAQERAAAIALATVPGAKLYFDGQFTGRHIKASVHLAREANEAPDTDLEAFYARLLRISASFSEDGYEWRLCSVDGWPDNQSRRCLLAWLWSRGEARHLIVINYNAAPAQGRVRVSLPPTQGELELHDAISGERLPRSAEEIRREGLFVSLDAWQTHYFELRMNAGEGS